MQITNVNLHLKEQINNVIIYKILIFPQMYFCLIFNVFFQFGILRGGKSMVST